MGSAHGVVGQGSIASGNNKRGMGACIMMLYTKVKAQQAAKRVPVLGTFSGM